MAFSPRLISITPSSQPLMTWPIPIVNWKGEPRSTEESNLVLHTVSTRPSGQCSLGEAGQHTTGSHNGRSNYEGVFSWDVNI